MKRNVKLLGSLALLIALTGLISACGSSSSDSSSSGGTTQEASTGGESGTGSPLGGKLVADIANVPNAFVTCLQESYLPGMEEQGAETFSVFGEFQPSKVKQAVEDSITKSPDLALYTSETPELDQQALTDLERANIPTVIQYGGAPEGTKPQAILNWNYAEYAAQMVEGLEQLAPEIKTVGIVSGIQGSPVAEEMTAELEKALSAAGVEVAGVLYGEFTSQGGAVATEDLLQSHSDVEAIFTYGDDMALAATRAVSKAGSDIPVLPIWTTSQAVIDQVKSGQMLYALYQPVEAWGEEIVDAVAQVAGGKTLPEQKFKQELIEEKSASSLQSPC